MLLKQCRGILYHAPFLLRDKPITAVVGCCCCCCCDYYSIFVIALCRWL